MAAPVRPRDGQETRDSAAPNAPAAPQKRLLACIECRRRKQKCDYGMPCVNCAKRFPQPACKYPTRNSRAKKAAATAAAAVDEADDEEPSLDDVLQSQTYSHLDLDGVKDVILQVEKAHNRRAKQVDTTASSSDADEEHFLDGSTTTAPPTADQVFRVAIRLASRNKPGHVDSATMLNALSLLMPHRADVTNHVAQGSWMEDVMRVPREADRFLGSLNLKSVDDGGGYSALPLRLTDMDKDLVRTHLQFLSRFKVSVDGCPDPENRFMRHWIPFSLSDPLLLQVLLMTSACFLNEWGHVPHAVVLMHKQRVYRRLNEALASPDVQSSDAAILALEQIVVDAWLWGGRKDLQAHITGLKAMIRMRGGFQNLGMQGYLSKLIIMNDISIALTHEIDPFIYGLPGFDFYDPFMTPLQRAYNSPLLFEAPSFLDPTSSLNINPNAARILDEIRSLFRIVLALPETPTEAQLQGAHTKALLTFQRVNDMPEDILMRCKSEPSSDYASECTSSTDDTAQKSEETERETPSSDLGSEHKQSPPSGKEDDLSRSNSGQVTDSSVATTAKPDLVYRCVRMVASIYCRAIIQRVPTSSVCDVNEYLSIWYPMWLVSLAAWNKIMGIFIWAMVAIVPSCHEAPKARFVESILVAGFMSTGVENWHVAMETADTALRLQAWLRGGASSQSVQSGQGGLGGKAPRYGEVEGLE